MEAPATVQAPEHVSVEFPPAPLPYRVIPAVIMIRRAWETITGLPDAAVVVASSHFVFWAACQLGKRCHGSFAITCN